MFLGRYRGVSHHGFKLLLLQVLLLNLQNALSVQNYNNAVTTVAELLEVKRNGKTDYTSAHHFYTSNALGDYPWEIPTSMKKTQVEGLSQQVEFYVIANNKTIVNYNKTTLPKCPDKFNYHKINQFNYCFFNTKPTSFPPQCPYPSTVEYYFILRHLHYRVSHQKHWAFTNRNVSDIGNENCFVTQGTVGGKVAPASCSDKYPGVCAYNYDINVHHPIAAPTFTHYCRNRYNASCISHNFDSPTKCYCRTEIKLEKQPRTAFCKKLVEITDPYQTNFLVELLGEHKRCWIGLQKNKDSYQWSSTNTTSNYTFWSNNTDFDKTYGALGADGWRLEDDGALNCAICEMHDKDPPQVKLHIEHNRSTNTLDVNILNAIGVFQNVTCFAQNSDDYKNIDLRYNKKKMLVVKQMFPFGTSGYYWCKALQIPNLTPIYSNTIFIATKAGHEYAFLIVLPHPDTYLPETSDDLACNSIRSLLNKMAVHSKPVKTVKLNEEDKTLEVLCHMTVKPTHLSRVEEFNKISNLLKNLDTITNLASVEACLASNTTSGNQTLHWPETPIGVTTLPEELCLQVDSSPVTRTCIGNFDFGSQWLNVNGTCADVTYSHTTNLLDGLIKSNTTTPSSLSMAILNITQASNNFTSFEIHLISKALETLATFNEGVSVSDMAKTINHIMHFEPNKLRDSQKTLNSTDMILYSLDEMLAKTEIDGSGYTSEVTEKLFVQISDLKKTNINGIKLKKTPKGFDSTKITPLRQGTTREDLLEENIELAVLIPPQLHDDVVNCMGENAPPKLIITVFYDDVLFNKQNNISNYTSSKVISVTIPDFNCSFSTPLQIIFNQSTNHEGLKCASWVYGLNDVMESIHGQWLIERDPKSFGNSNYQVCEFAHTTHFTLLVLGGNYEISVGHKKALDTITAVGNGLSILGLLMVFLSAIIFKRFRSANAIVIHFSIATTAQIVLLYVAGNAAENDVLCIVVGAALHYIILAQFCWMLTIAVLQYRRYVVVFSTPARHLVAKSCACSWGIPLIPVIIIMSISTNNYGKNSYGLCYALGNYFIFGVVIPVALIIFINLIVFLRIMLSIGYSRKIAVHQIRDDRTSLQLRLAVMLYFLLGLTWGFGLLVAINGGIVYSYLFCLTGTLQGFIIFWYFIVLNEKTRSLLKNMKICPFRGNSNLHNFNTDLSVTTTLQKRKISPSKSNANSTSAML